MTYVRLIHFGVEQQVIQFEISVEVLIFLAYDMYWNDFVWDKMYLKYVIYSFKCP